MFKTVLNFGHLIFDIVWNLEFEIWNFPAYGGAKGGEQQMDKQKLGLIVLIIGIAIVAISSFADVLGYGEGGFGPKQGIGVIVGLIFIILGWLWWKNA